MLRMMTATSASGIGAPDMMDVAPWESEISFDQFPCILPILLYKNKSQKVYTFLGQSRCRLRYLMTVGFRGIVIIVYVVAYNNQQQLVLVKNK